MEQISERPEVAARMRSAKRREDELFGKQFAKDHEEDAKRQAATTKTEEWESLPGASSEMSLPAQERKSEKRKADDPGAQQHRDTGGGSDR